IKGHIVATRYATEEDSDRLKTTVFAEDPSSPGREPLNKDSSPTFARAVLATHYSTIASKLRQPVLASSLANGIPMPAELRVVGVAWRVLNGPLEGRRFVGGYFAVDGAGANIRHADGQIKFEARDPLRL